MYMACDEKNNRVDVSVAHKDKEYFCPVCGAEVIVKEGAVNAKHFAHKNRECVDHWSYDMSEWHRKKQGYFPMENRETVVSYGGETHRADILIQNTVIEFQHSTITAKEFAERNKFFTAAGYRIAWVFDVSSAFESENLSYANDDDNNLMAWKHPMRIFSESPNISDYNKNFSLWFSWEPELSDEGEEIDYINKIIWTGKNDDGKPDLKRFIISPYYINLKEPVDVGEFFYSKRDYFNHAVDELSQKYPYSTKYVGEKGHPRQAYVCPKRENEFGIKLFSEKGCRYCCHCYMIAEKRRIGQKTISEVYCCYPKQVREKDGDEEYECSVVQTYDL